MQLLGFSASQVHPLASLDAARDFLAGNAAARFVWVDTPIEEISAAPTAWRDSVQALTGAPVLDLHLIDATNPSHPSFFDTTHVYDMVIFRKLTFETSRLIAEAGAEGAAACATAGPQSAAKPSIPTKPRRYPPGFLPALAKIDTQPVTFFVFDNVLLTVRPAQSRTLDQVRQRLLELCQAPRPQAASKTRANGHAALVHGIRPPTRPEDLMLRLLNAMVDRYLDLRAPLTRQLDRWQRALLNARRSFSSWEGLLDARIELRRLEHLCEEQHDALQEFRDSLLDNSYSIASEGPAAGTAGRDDALLVRINDVMEHISRVLAHARRLEDSIESAVQIHFSSVAHRTNRTMRTLTLITALFMPLTLITGIFGMNFDRMPWLREPQGFWWSLGLMGAVVVVLAAVWALGRRLEQS
ncbi:magnesium transporter CorA family protein [Cupriavidus basilensis]|uniref:magnesium transporter CorA family protein n=1 Tax=Cupriavidus basilensis TaxID=68895 RepID=UPI0020A62B09|nr:magnesium transporter CorA family protein [Cupriavidus basilensis]MCP3022522.1 magnesium transporter CorA family protein [Cupriavidus basilensis]